MLQDILWFLLGLAMVVAGGNYLTDGATVIARKLHVSGLVIGLTVVAFGSSAPDLVVCLMSTIQGHSQLALGDVVGANIFDILLVIGIVAVIRPITITSDMRWKGLPMLLLASLALFFCGDWLVDGASGIARRAGLSEGPKVISRREGNILIALYVVYAVKLIADVIQH